MSIQTSSPPAVPAEAPAKRSAVEAIKENSRQLRGGIAEELQNDTDHFSEQDKNLLKFHGSYQQEDRDARKTRRKEGVGKHHMFMVRCKIPGGRLTAAQYLAVDDLAGAYANGTLRLTSRQGIQLHGILKNNLKETIAGINACLLSTLGACGDVERNVMACPAPHHHNGIHAQLQETAAVLAAHLAPRTRAYHEIWLNGKPLGEQSGEADIEPLYGKTYLPRKFKTGLALPEDNCVDIYAQDLGLLAVCAGEAIAGYNVLVGGGMGMTHGNANTFPYLARPICYVPAGAVVSAAEAVVRLFRDHGNRADRKRARIKYLVHDWGVNKFRDVLAGYVGGQLQEPRPVEVHGFETHLGWHPQGDGKWYYGLSIENGRVKDEGSLRLRSGLRALLERFRPSLRLTPLQDILLCDLPGSAKPEIERTLAEYGILPPERLSTVQRYSMACPAVPTCGLALSESERALPGIIDELEAVLKRLGLAEEKLSVRMTGCPNGCARPYQSDIGIVGRSGDKYTLFVGGHVLGHRLSFMLEDLVPRAEIVPMLEPLLEHFKQSRQPAEGFGDYCQRLGAERLRGLRSTVGSSSVLTPREAVRLSPRIVAAEGAKHGNGTVAEPKAKNGDAQPAAFTAPGVEAVASSPALGVPQTQSVSLQLAEPVVTAHQARTPGRRSETFLAGLPGEELPDYRVRYHTDGSVQDTVVFFYGGDHRAATAQPSDPLRREATYQGRVDSGRLHAARKLSDTYYVGPAGQERRDIRLEYDAEGCLLQTVVFLYEGDCRAADVSSGAALRRQVVFEGGLG
jgi:sulfite reductase (ferredoxin)